MFSIALLFIDNDGNNQVRAYSIKAKTRFDALGKAFGMCAANEDINCLTDWSISAPHEAIIEAITPDVLAGKKIAAIKALRAVENMGLKSAKEYVEKYWDAIRAENPFSDI